MAYYAITAMGPRWNYETKSGERGLLHLILRSGENGITTVVDEHRADSSVEICELCIMAIAVAANKEQRGRSTTPTTNGATK